jgi:hypothetical protein
MTNRKAKCIERTFDSALFVVMITMLANSVYSTYYLNKYVFGGEPGERYYNSFVMWEIAFVITASFMLLGSIGLLVSIIAFR